MGGRAVAALDNIPDDVVSAVAERLASTMPEAFADPVEQSCNPQGAEEMVRRFLESLLGRRGAGGVATTVAFPRLGPDDRRAFIELAAKAFSDEGVREPVVEQIRILLAAGHVEGWDPRTTSGNRNAHQGERNMTNETIEQAHRPEARPGDGLLSDPNTLQASMDAVQANILIADTNLNIVYANEVAIETLRGIDTEIRTAFGVGAEQILGGPIHRFHRDPQGVERILRNRAALPHETEFTFGTVTLRAVINGIFDGTGAATGYIVNWEDVTERKALESEQARIQAMVENAPVNVMMADQDLTILYANPASIKTLQTLAEYLPVPVDQVVGSNIDIFHKNPAHQRQILADPANLPVRTLIQIGPETADLLVSPITDHTGRYMGPMVTWEVVTEKKRMEQEQFRIQSMIENAPINLMMADRDLTITYVNPASRKTLQSLAQYLPVPVEQVVGSSVDIFHKNPAHQRQILANPANLPVKAQIQIGPETADLLVSPIYDSAGEYIGPMVSWSVTTERLRVETQVESTATTLASSSEELTTISSQMSTAAEETSSQANVVASAAEEVSKNVDTVATATEEMSASIREISSNTSEAARIAGEAVTAAQTTSETMGKLEHSSAEIGQVIKVITSIAEQTNLLALNATIEAARAGEAGKGFAVVANEVKELAKETAKATEDIGQRVQTIQGDTRAAVEAIDRISQVISQISDIQSTIAGAVEEQTVTTNEIGQNVSEASKGANEIAQNISGVATAAQQTASAANDALTSSGELSKLAQELQSLLDEARKKREEADA